MRVTVYYYSVCQDVIKASKLVFKNKVYYPNNLRPQQHRRHFADDIFENILFRRKFSILTQIEFTDIAFYGFVSLSDNKSSVVSGDGLVANRRQAITWTNDKQVHWPVNE